jgi:chemotaxis protein histidine kinase CheA
MGLFMVKTQVEKLGGRISVTSTEGEKTEFKITFPL